MEEPMITIIIPYYRNPEMLKFQMEQWAAWPQFVKNQTKFIIVDDGSPEPLELESCPYDLKVARIEENIPWNFSGAKNLGVHLCDTEWFLLHDIDYVFHNPAMKEVLELDRSRPHIFYRFKCVMNNSGKAKRKDHHPISSFFSSRTNFWAAGGHDEDFSGHYTCHDNAIYWRMTRNPGLGVDIKLDYPYMTAYVKGEIGDADTDHEAEGWNRNGSRNRFLLTEKRREAVEWSNDILRFQWHIAQEFTREDP
jgi:glycosyltransferase involved in cell wall biosynthesis